MKESSSGRWTLEGGGGLLILTAILLILPVFIQSNFHLRVMVLVWVFALAALGLNLLMGYAGQVSLGHAGFVAIGAYSVALGPSLLGVSSFLSLLGGIVLSALIALVVGRPILRLKGHYLSVATLGFGILVFMFLNNEVALTGGPDGTPVGRLELFNWTARGNITWYWITGGVFVIGAWLSVNLINSPTGLALRSIRDSEIASSALGINVARYKLIVFVISASYAAAAGGLLALFNGYITPTTADFLLSVQLVTMVVLGGMGSMLGAVCGAALLVILPQFLTAVHEYEHAFLGLIMILTMIFMRSGIVPTLAAALSRDKNG